MADEKQSTRQQGHEHVTVDHRGNVIPVEHPRTASAMSEEQKRVWYAEHDEKISGTK